MNIVLATHGNFAEGILSSAKLILGEQLCANISVICAYTTEEYDLQFEAKKQLEKFKHQPVIVITDVFGGSVNNQFFELQAKYQFELITGLNLPLLLEIISSGENINVEKIVESSKQSIMHCKLEFDESEVDEF